MKEGPSLPEQYIENYIWKKSFETCRAAAETTDPFDPVVDEAIFYDKILRFPDPELSPDDNYVEGENHHGD